MRSTHTFHTLFNIFAGCHMLTKSKAKIFYTIFKVFASLTLRYRIIFGNLNYMTVTKSVIICIEHISNLIYEIKIL